MGAVRQARQGVIGREEGDLVPHEFDRRQVASGKDHVGHGALAVLDRGRYLVEIDTLSVFAGIHYLGLELLSRKHELPLGQAVLCLVFLGLEQGHAACHELIASVAGYLLHGFVHEFDFAFPVGDHHKVGGLFHGKRELGEQLLCAL